MQRVFNVPAALQDDRCGTTRRDGDNAASANYMLTGYQPDCSMKKAISIASLYPTLNFSGSRQVEVGGCNINQNSELLITDITKAVVRHCNNVLTLPRRLWVADIDVDADTSMRAGGYQNRKSLNPSSEHRSKLCQTPMIPQLRAILNPAILLRT